MRGQIRFGLIAVLVILVGIAAAITSSYNSMVKLHENIPAAWAQVENVLQRRNDMIPNLVNTVKGYAKHEETIFVEVAQARAAVNSARTTSERVEANNRLGTAITGIFALQENYPNLKADTSFLRLQDELAGTENRISVERKRYNEMVQEYNTKVKTFPTSFLAHLSGFAPEPYFKATEAAHNVPTVQF